MERYHYLYDRRQLWEDDGSAGSLYELTLIKRIFNAHLTALLGVGFAEHRA